MLGLGSVVGEEFEPAVLQAASALDEEVILSALEEGSAARLLSPAPAGRFRFAHALVRATLYDELSNPRKVVLHRKVAEDWMWRGEPHLSVSRPASCMSWRQEPKLSAPISSRRDRACVQMSRHCSSYTPQQSRPRYALLRR